MSNKLNKTISVTELKQQIKKRLVELAPLLDSQDRMRLALNLGLDTVVTIKRYLDGNIGEVRNLELAEKIADAAEKLLAEKQPA